MLEIRENVFGSWIVAEEGQSQFLGMFASRSDAELFVRAKGLAEVAESLKSVQPDLSTGDYLSLIREREERMKQETVQMALDELERMGVQPDVVLGDVPKPATYARIPIQYVDKLPESFIWNDRMVKVQDDLLWLSAKGRWDDFETADTGLPYGMEAIALNAGVPVLRAERVDDRNLRFTNGVLVDHKGDSNFRDFVVGADVDLTLVCKSRRVSGSFEIK